MAGAAEIKKDDNKDAISQYDLAEKYHCGNGVEENIPEAVKYYLLAAEAGYAPAQNALGEIYCDSNDLKGDPKIACYYNSGRAIESDNEQAFKWYLSAATAGDKTAMYNLGEMYYKGYFLKTDYKKAHHWFKLSADQGNGDSQKMLGDIYYYGQGVKKNLEESFRWYKLSANQDNEDGLLGLAFMYRYGQGIEKDIVEAFKCYKKSKELYRFGQADEEIKKMLSEESSLLPPTLFEGFASLSELELASPLLLYSNINGFYFCIVQNRIKLKITFVASSNSLSEAKPSKRVGGTEVKLLNKSNIEKDGRIRELLEQVTALTKSISLAKTIIQKSKELESNDEDEYFTKLKF